MAQTNEGNEVITQNTIDHSSIIEPILTEMDNDASHDLVFRIGRVYMREAMLKALARYDALHGQRTKPRKDGSLSFESDSSSILNNDRVWDKPSDKQVESSPNSFGRTGEIPVLDSQETGFKESKPKIEAKLSPVFLNSNNSPKGSPETLQSSYVKTVASDTNNSQICKCGHPREEHSLSGGMCMHEVSDEQGNHWIECQCDQFREAQA